MIKEIFQRYEKAKAQVSYEKTKYMAFVNKKEKLNKSMIPPISKLGFENKIIDDESDEILSKLIETGRTNRSYSHKFDSIKMNEINTETKTVIE
jgi:hypothetical protein